MPPDDWTKLEHLAARLEDLHHRRLFAEQRENELLLQQIDEEIVKTEAERKRLLGRIRLRMIEEA
jgi:hypothetical protein